MEKLQHLPKQLALAMNESNLPSSLELIYDVSKQQIFEVADTIMSGIIKDGGLLVSIYTEPKLPENEVWDFHVGDAVIIKFSREDFEWMQKRTIGWDEKQNQIHGCIGIVKKVYSEFDGEIIVYFPQEYVEYTLYAGVLKKVNPPKYPKLNSRWKVGDFVRTISSIVNFENLQQGLSKLPKELIGVRGRVVAVTQPCVLVTYNEKQAYALRSASLLQCEDKSPLITEEMKHAHRFKIGEKVKITSNLKRLIENQKRHGEWIWQMCKITGNQQTIVHEHGDVIVRMSYDTNWRINPDSVLHLTETELEEKDLKFHPNDIVKVTLPRNIQKNLAAIKAPISFLEYLQTVAIISGVNKDFKYCIPFNNCWIAEIDKKLLRKATVREELKYKTIEKKVNKLKIGDKVQLDVGPPNFIQAMVHKLDLDPTVAMAMMHSATLIGYTKPSTALIQYKNGQRFQVDKRCLTVPEKFLVNESEDVEFIVDCIRKAIAQSVEDITKNSPTEDWEVNAVFVSHGVSPYIEYEIKSTLATSAHVHDWLYKNPGWSVVELLEEDHFILWNTILSIAEVEVRLIFTGENSISDDHATQDIAVGHKEKLLTKQKIDPIRENDDSKDLKFLDQNPAQDVLFPVCSPDHLAVKKITQEPISTKKIEDKWFPTEIDLHYSHAESKLADNFSSQKFKEKQKFPFKEEGIEETSKNFESEKDTTKVQVHSHDKSQQTDFPSPKSQEEQQHAYNMGCPVMTTKVIGPKGGIIELFRYKVVYPPKSLKEEKEIELSIDNNPCNFPEEGLPITSILNIKPSMKLDVPAMVTMPTTCRATSGEVAIQIWNKEKGQDWEKSQTVALTNKNEITFEVDHFCGKTGTTLNEKEDNLEFINIQNRFFIQKDTGIILSIFWQKGWFIQETMTRCLELEYKDLQPTNEVLAGKLDKKFEVAVTCISPNSFKYSSDTGEDPAIFKITSKFIKSRTPKSIMFLPSVDEIPPFVKQLRIQYSVTTQMPITRIVKWPIKIKDAGSSSANQDI